MNMIGKNEIFTLYGVKLNVKISYFHMNAHTETYMPLITCIIDDTDGKNAAAGLPSHDVDELKQSLIDVWHGFEQSVINVRKYET